MSRFLKMAAVGASVSGGLSLLNQYDPFKFSNKKAKRQEARDLLQEEYQTEALKAQEKLSKPLNVPNPHSFVQSKWTQVPTAAWTAGKTSPSQASWALSGFGTPTEQVLQVQAENAEKARIYPWDKIGYTNQNPNPPPLKASSYADMAEKARQSCKTCQVAQPDLVPMGCGIAMPDGEDLNTRGRQTVNSWRPLPGYNDIPIGENPIYITEPNRPKNATDNSGLTPLFSHYNADLWKTPLDRSENMMSTGFMINAFTGELAETFEKAMPPPTTDKYTIDPEQLKHTNPKLVFLNGGIDPNRPPLSKREVCLSVPDASWGPNVWGEQLYTERVEDRLKEYAESQLFNNRNGIYSCEPGMPKEAPAGMVGLVNALRAIPYLPPTQRSSISLEGYLPGGINGVNGTYDIGNLIEEHGLVETTKIDLTGNTIDSARPFSISGEVGTGTSGAEMAISMNPPKPTMRGTLDGTVTGALSSLDIASLSVNPTVRETLKVLNELEFPISAGVSEFQQGSYAVLDPTVRDTLKQLNDLEFTKGGYLSESNQGSYTIQDPSVRETLKSLNELEFSKGGTLSENNQGAYTLQDPTVRDTLKTLNERPLTAFQSPETAEVIPHTLAGIQDPSVRQTLKTLNEQTLPATLAHPTNLVPETQAGIQDPSVRETLKTLNDRQYPVTTGSPQALIPSTILSVTDPTVRETLKGLNDLSLRTSSPQDLEESGYLVIDRTVRETLKTLNELELEHGAPENPDTGDYLPFQGEFRIGPRSEFYSTDTLPGSWFFTPSSWSGTPVGPPNIISKQNRGQDELFWVENSQIVQEGGNNTMTRWLGLNTRDTKQELGPSTPGADFTQDNGVFLTSERQYPLVFPNCQHPDDLDDEFLTMRPDHFRPGF